jgi:predicted DNA-binding transcriptional regulator AlpA
MNVRTFVRVRCTLLVAVVLQEASVSASAHRAENTLRRGLRRPEAAMYIGVSPSLFDQLVKEGAMPQPVKIRSCTRWDIRDLDEAFDALKTERDDTAENEADDWKTAV